MRRGTVLFAAVAAGTLLAGCGSGPSQVGAAAIVGDTAIPLEHVQDWFDQVTADRELKEQARANGMMDDIGRDIATEAVRHELLLVVASSEELYYNEAQVTDLIEELGGPAAVAEGTLYSADTFRDRARDQLLALELGRKYFETAAVTFDYTSATSRAGAIEAAEELAAAEPDEIKTIIDRNVRNGVDASLDVELAMRADPQRIAVLPVFCAAEGDVIAFLNAVEEGQGSSSWIVAKVREVGTVAPPADPDSEASADQVDPRLMEDIGLRLLARIAGDVEVKLNPRYGVWDPVLLEAAPNEGEMRTIVVPAGESND